MVVESSVVRLGVVASPFFLLIFSVLLGFKVRLKTKDLASISTVWVVLTLISIALSPLNTYGSGVYLFLYLFSGYFFLLIINGLSRFQEFDFIWFGLYSYVALNFSLLILGIVNKAEYINGGVFGKALILKFLGLDFDRTLPFFAPGFQAYGLMLGVVILSVLFSYPRKISNYKAFSIVACSAWQLLITDSRGAIVFVLAALILSIFARFFSRGEGRANKLFVSVSLLFSVLFGFALYYFNKLLGSSSDLARGGNMLSNRDVIWESAVAFIGKEPWVFIFGGGFGSHKSYGVMSYYEDLFDGWSGGENSIITLHNSWLQLLFDTGAVGVLLAIFMMTRKSLGGNNLFFYSALMFLSLYGASDVMLSPYNILGCFVFLVLVVSPSNRVVDS
tara:strand:- start:1386 stop:2555 length:1170 start_codon:yes stop_codon:yes gene_type:complete